MKDTGGPLHAQLVDPPAEQRAVVQLVPRAVGGHAHLAVREHVLGRDVVDLGGRVELPPAHGGVVRTWWSC